MALTGGSVNAQTGAEGAALAGQTAADIVAFIVINTNAVFKCNGQASPLIQQNCILSGNTGQNLTIEAEVYIHRQAPGSGLLNILGQVVVACLGRCRSAAPGLIFHQITAGIGVIVTKCKLAIDAAHISTLISCVLIHGDPATVPISLTAVGRDLHIAGGYIIFTDGAVLMIEVQIDVSALGQLIHLQQIVHGGQQLVGQILLVIAAGCSGTVDIVGDHSSAGGDHPGGIGNHVDRTGIGTGGIAGDDGAFQSKNVFIGNKDRAAQAVGAIAGNGRILDGQVAAVIAGSDCAAALTTGIFRKVTLVQCGVYVVHLEQRTAHNSPAAGSILLSSTVALKGAVCNGCVGFRCGCTVEPDGAAAAAVALAGSTFIVSCVVQELAALSHQGRTGNQTDRTAGKTAVFRDLAVIEVNLRTALAIDSAAADGVGTGAGCAVVPDLAAVHSEGCAVDVNRAAIGGSVVVVQLAAVHGKGRSGIQVDCTTVGHSRNIAVTGNNAAIHLELSVDYKRTVVCRYAGDTAGILAIVQIQRTVYRIDTVAGRFDAIALQIQVQGATLRDLNRIGQGHITGQVIVTGGRQGGTILPGLKGHIRMVMIRPHKLITVFPHFHNGLMGRCLQNCDQIFAQTVVGTVSIAHTALAGHSLEPDASAQVGTACITIVIAIIPAQLVHNRTLTGDRIGSTNRQFIQRQLLADHIRIGLDLVIPNLLLFHGVHLEAATVVTDIGGQNFLVIQLGIRQFGTHIVIQPFMGSNVLCVDLFCFHSTVIGMATLGVEYIPVIKLQRIIQVHITVLRHTVFIVFVQYVVAFVVLPLFINQIHSSAGLEQITDRCLHTGSLQQAVQLFHKIMALAGSDGQDVKTVILGRILVLFVSLLFPHLLHRLVGALLQEGNTILS